MTYHPIGEHGPESIDTLPAGWVVPELRKNYETGEVEILTPLRCYGGYTRLLATFDDAPRCPAQFDTRSACPLEDGHIGDHWQAALELIAEMGTVHVWAELVDDGNGAA